MNRGYSGNNEWRRDYSQLNDVVLVTREGRLTGAATVRALLECMTALRTEAARTANPLTGLPGNIGIQKELRHHIARKRAFAVIYGDLDYFKWYNDCFGFGMGDELIRYVANLLVDTVKKLGEPDDFIGHIGGDDFIVIMTGGNAEQLCQTLIKRFDEEVVSFYGGATVTEVEDRYGNRVAQNGVTLSLALMLWDEKRAEGNEISETTSV